MQVSETRRRRQDGKKKQGKKQKVRQEKAKQRSKRKKAVIGIKERIE